MISYGRFNTFYCRILHFRKLYVFFNENGLEAAQYSKEIRFSNSEY